MTKTTSTTFKQAYGVLQSHAETLRNQREPNIDDLLTIVTESVEAYKVCKIRIAAVEQALEQALNSVETDAGERKSPTAPKRAAASKPSSVKHPPTPPVADSADAFEDGDEPF
ncbi:exodeoxyribonuclease VII small subunit [Roseateles sp.]|uniref:exodeoxyribonuclease VII small subunit n=1 Tax=Roseateles sp. TaxID=1971397 RepID=UPI00286C2AB9|nr:exodeoxyribonuclease VII small subunit [Roseateles sp.]